MKHNNDKINRIYGNFVKERTNNEVIVPNKST